MADKPKKVLLDPLFNNNPIALQVLGALLTDLHRQQVRRGLHAADVPGVYV